VGRKWRREEKTLNPMQMQLNTAHDALSRNPYKLQAVASAWQRALMERWRKSAFRCARMERRRRPLSRRSDEDADRQGAEEEITSSQRPAAAARRPQDCDARTEERGVGCARGQSGRRRGDAGEGGVREMSKAAAGKGESRWPSSLGSP
jgi:hypothetical protein